ncbi:MAG: glycerophosphodiester phosphodiesterase [Planctomycetota bacterium]
MATLSQKRSVRWWLRRLSVLALLALLVTGAAFQFLRSRLYFSYQHVPGLERLRGTARQTTSGLKFPTIIGHRGTAEIGIRDGQLLGVDGQPLRPGGAPLRIGNSAGAIDRARAAGVKWIELDLRVSSDGELVVFHDESLFPRVRDASPGDQLSEYSSRELAAMALAVQPPQQVLFLQGVLSQFEKQDVVLVFDIKDKNAAGLLCDKLTEVFSRETLDPEQIVVFGQFEELNAFAKSRSESPQKDRTQLDRIQLGYTMLASEPGSLRRVLFAPSEILARANQRQCRYLVLPITYASRGLIEKATGAGLQVFVYGSDDTRDYHAMHAAGVSGFITDYPEAAMEFFTENRP